MGSPSSLPAAAAALVLLALLAGGGHCREAQVDATDAGTAENFNTSDAAVYWGPWQKARATWYGQPNGAGPDDNGGACGFKHTNHYPFMSMGSCGNQPLFKDGKGCGSCYKIRCTKDKSCSGKAETVIITDMNYYPVSKYHFDLSGTAFGAMAKPGLNDKLRHSGIIDIEFTRWRPETHTFHLPCGEMTLTMQDVKAMFGLRLGGLPVIGIVDNDHWRELVAQFIGFLPPDDVTSKKNKKSYGVSSSWITERFDYLDP